MNRAFAAATVIVVLVVSGAETAAQQPRALTADDFSQATRDDKRAYLRGLVERELNVEPKQLTETFRAALVDSDPRIRELSLAAITARALGPQMGRNSGAKAVAQGQWIDERSEMVQLRTMIERALDDEDQDVRFQAVSALQAIDFDGKQMYGKKLSSPTSAFLASHYRKETSPRVRRAIIQVLGGAAELNGESHKTLEAAMRDQSRDVRQVAMLGLMDLGPAVALPSIVAALGDTDAAVRRQASLQIVRAGNAAKGYVSEIQAALSRGEADAATRQNLETALKQLQP